MEKLKKFFKEEDGATAVEYAIMVSLIAAVVIGAVTVLGTTSKSTFNKAVTAMGGTAAP
jgi:pilus assembly protein Flp/PilA